MTVRAISSPELVKLRGDNQYAEVFAIPRVPNVIYTARLNTVPSTTDMVAEIDIDSGSGDDSAIREDMKVLVGTSAGADDLGFCRVRKVPSLTLGAGTLEIGELSHIDWQAECYITINDDYDIFPRHLKIVSGVPYIDYDVEYVDQHEEFQPIVNMGGHRVIILDADTGEASHVRSASESQVFDGTISSYLWESPDAASVDDETTDEATFTYDTAGHFCEYLTLTTNDGKTWTGVRYVFVLSETPSDSTITSLRIEENTTDGASFEFTMPQNSSLDDFNHRAFVIVWCKTYYQGTQSYISTRTGEQNILASGRIAFEKLSFNDEIGNITFTAKNWKYWLEKVSSFPIGLERAVSTAAAWTDMTGLNVDRAIWALLHEYCTVTRICDFHPSGDTRYAEELMSMSNNISSQVDDISFTSIYADLVFDRYESAWLRVEAQLVPESDRSGWVVVQPITSDDCETGFSFEINPHEEMSQSNLSGVSVSQYGSGSPHFSLSYGRIFSVFGNSSQEGNLLLESQEQSNSLAGLVMGWANRSIGSLSVKFTGINQMFSIAEYCRASIVISASSNPRGFEYDGYLCPRFIEYVWEENTGVLSVTVEFEDESVEQISVTGDFPVESGIEDIDLSFPPMPRITVPPLALIPMPASITNPNHPKKVVIATSQGVFYTEDFDSDAPTWIAMNSGLSSGQIASIEQFVVTPSGTMYLLSEWTAGRGYMTVMGCAGIGGTWKQILHADAVPSTPSSTGGIWGMGVDAFKADQVAVWGGRGWSWPYDGNIGQGRMAFVNQAGGSFGGVLTEYAHPRRSMLARAGERWYVACSQGTGILGSNSSPYCVITSKTGGFLDAFLLTGSDAANYAVTPVGRQDKAMIWDDGGVAGYNIVVAAATHSTLINPDSPYAVAFSPDGQNGMGASGGSYSPYKTTDGGASWQSVGGVIPNGFSAWENCGDTNRFLFAGGTEVRLTLDNGASYVNKAGNLSVVAPLVNISAVRFLS